MREAGMVWHLMHTKQNLLVIWPQHSVFEVTVYCLGTNYVRLNGK
jgi:hypothetical protein